jgi:hypothetical protein
MKKENKKRVLEPFIKKFYLWREGMLEYLEEEFKIPYGKKLIITKILVASDRGISTLDNFYYPSVNFYPNGMNKGYDLIALADTGGSCTVLFEITKPSKFKVDLTNISGDIHFAIYVEGYLETIKPEEEDDRDRT